MGKDNGNAAKSQYQAIFETAIDGIIVLDEHGIIQSFNRAAQELFGYEPGEVMGQNVRMLMPDPDRTLHDSYLANYRTTGVPKIIGVGREVIGRGKDGSSIPLDLSIAQWTADGCRYFTGIVRDLTERKRSEEQRRADEARYRAIVDTAVDAIVVIDERGLIQSFNNAAERLFGYSAEEAIGETVNVLMPEHYESEHDRYMQNYKSTGVRKIIGKGREVSGRRKDGSLFPMELSVAEWRSEQGHYFTGIMRDISDRKIAEEETHRAQTQLQQLNQRLEERVSTEVAEREAAQMMATHAERMRTLGQLAGGVAHDFNNVLQAVFSAVDRLENKATTPDAARRAVQTIATAAERGASVTERLLAFARRSILKTVPIDLTEVLSELAGLLGQTLGAAVTVHVQVDSGIPPLLADRSQLETVLVNLATNARDAMPDGGIVTFSAARVRVVRPDADEDALSPGNYIRITVVDTGIGMDQTTLERATEPFFTTKPQGEGTGLGLSMAKGFAEQSGGWLLIRSTVGQGTTIDLFLPEAETGFGVHAASENAPESGKRHILLVDDDTLVLNALGWELEAEGYTVSCAEGATEATAIFASKGADLLLTDLLMPHVDGITLIENLQALKPNLPAILITGGNAERANSSHAALFRMIRKPVNGAKLHAAISASFA